jgi:ABC-type Zn uptake system ZnuABC Zn-binding protein ZnuA
MRNVSILVLALCFGVALARAEKLRVSSFSTVLTEIAQEVGGDRVTVTGHVKPGVDPHDFEPKSGDLKTVASADVILLSARHLEGYVGRLREAAGGRAAIVEVGDKLPALGAVPGAGGHGHGGEDPHWWHSIGNIERATRIVRDEFIRLRPGDKAAFSVNAAAYLGRLDALERWVKAKVAELPRDRRKLVTSHDAFGYFAKEFGFTVYPIAGISRSDQPGSRKVAEIIGTIRAQGVKAIFPEASENPKVLAQITQETGARLGGELLADGLGAGSLGTVEAMFRHNVTSIVEALK